MFAVTQSYLTYQSGHLRRRSYTEVERHLLQYCKPLHGLQIAEDRPPHGCRPSIWMSPAVAVQRRATVCARRCRRFSAGRCGKVWPTATRSPAAIAQAEHARARVLDDDELRIIWNALGSDDYSAIIKLLILTGSRREEIGSLCWSEVTGDQIVLPPQRTKNNRGHRIPIVPAVRAILKAASVTARSCLADTPQSHLLVGVSARPDSIGASKRQGISSSLGAA